MQHINLYRPPPKKPFEMLGLEGMLLMAGVISLLLFTMGMISRQALGRDKALLAETQASQDRLSQEMTRLAQSLPKKEPDLALAADLQRLEREVAYLPILKVRLEGQEIGSPEGFVRFLKALALKTPDGLWLTHFQILQGGRQFTFKGKTLAAERVPAFLQALGQAPAFADQAFEHLILTHPTQEDRWLEFSLFNHTNTTNPAGGR